MSRFNHGIHCIEMQSLVSLGGDLPTSVKCFDTGLQQRGSGNLSPHCIGRGSSGSGVPMCKPQYPPDASVSTVISPLGDLVIIELLIEHRQFCQ